MRIRHLIPALIFCGALLLAGATRAAAQSAEAFPPVDPAELALKDNPAHPGAAAMILYRETHTDDVKAFTTHYFRIKIFNEEGKKYANVEIPYIDKDTRVEEIRARTVRPGGTVQDFQGTVYDKVVARTRGFQLQAKTFTLPGVEAGSIVEYRFVTRWKNSFPDWLREPQGYVWQRGVTYSTETWVLQSDLFTRKARFSLRPLPKPRVVWTTQWVPKERAPRQQADGSFLLELENIEAFQKEDWMPPEATLKPRVNFYYVVGPVFSADSYWDGLGRTLGERDEAFIGKSKRVEKEVAQIVLPGDPLETKLRKLYARAQRVRYLSYERARDEKEIKKEDLKPNKNVDEILKNGYASANEVNFLFVALARAAGFNANLLRVTSRANDAFSDQRLLAEQLDAIVVRVRLGSQEWFLDPATKYCPFDMLPWEETWTRGVLATSVGGVLVSTPEPNSSSATAKRTGEFRLLEDGTLEGKVRVAFLGQEALTRRLRALDEDESGRRKQIEDEVKAWFPASATVEMLSIEPWEAAEEPLRAEASIRLPNYAARTGRRLLVPFGVLQSNRSYPFQQTQRKHEVYVRYPFQVLDDVTIELPAGVEIENLPAPQKVTQDFGRLETEIQQEGNRLRLKQQFILEKIVITREKYSRLRSFYDRMRSANEENLVLRFAEAARNP